MKSLPLREGFRVGYLSQGGGILNLRLFARIAESILDCHESTLCA